MAAGMPSVGIGGLFYLASTLLLPVRRGWRAIRGEQDTVPPSAIAHALLIAIGMIAGIWLAGWLLALAIPQETLRGLSGPASVAATSSRSLVRVATIAAGFVTLAFVLMVVEIARRVARRRERV